MQHRRSTDGVPCHELCPKGPQSWCGWQRPAAGTEDYTHHHSLLDAVFEAIKPTYIQLASKELLERCLRGATQNQNESFNGLVWGHCPKESFCGLGTVETAACLSVLHFNDGAKAICKVLAEMGCLQGVFTMQQVWDEDKE